MSLRRVSQSKSNHRREHRGGEFDRDLVDPVEGLAHRERVEDLRSTRSRTMRLERSSDCGAKPTGLHDLAVRRVPRAVHRDEARRSARTANRAAGLEDRDVPLRSRSRSPVLLDGRRMSSNFVDGPVGAVESLSSTVVDGRLPCASRSKIAPQLGRSVTQSSLVRGVDLLEGERLRVGHRPVP